MSDDLEDENRKLRIDLEGCETDYTNMRIERDGLQAKIDRLRAENERLQERVSTLEYYVTQIYELDIPNGNYVVAMTFVAEICRHVLGKTPPVTASADSPADPE